MIGGRVLDASALAAFCDGSSVYAQALVWTSVEEGLVLLVPSTAVAAAASRLAEEHHEVLEVLLRLPVTVVDDLTGPRGIAVGALGGEPLDAHAELCARDRGWPLVTAGAVRYADGVEIEALP